MANKPLIAVVGATGAQGGGLVRAILSDSEPKFAARAITRNPESDKARLLAELGAEVVQADLDDKDSLVKAFTGCHGAFCVTNFWEHFSPEKEMAQVKNMAQAAKEAGIKHAIWSTLEDVRTYIPLDDDRMPTLHGNYKVPHFDGKGASDKFFAEAGVPTTNLVTTFYWDNMLGFGMETQRGEDGSLTFALPMGDKPLAGMAAEDIGKCAYGIFKAGDKYIGQTVGITGENLTGQEMAAALSRALGEPVSYYAVPFDTYRSFDFPGADDLGNMFQFYHDFNEDFLGNRSAELARSLNPDMLDFDDWLAKYGDRIPRH